MANVLTYLALAVFVLLVLALIKESVRRRLAERLANSSYLVLVLAGGLLLANGALYALTGSWDSGKFGTLLLFFAVPALLIFSGEVFRIRTGWPAALLDLAIILSIWLPNEFDWVYLKWKINGSEYPFGAVSAVIFCLLAFTAWRRIDLKLDWKWSWRDWRMILQFYQSLLIIILPAALKIGFAHWGIWKQYSQWPTAFVFIWMGTGLVEELIFRAMIQRVLVERLGAVWGILLGALVFGFSHLNNRAGDFHYPNWPYVIFATLAGLAYGITYYKRNMQSSITLHTFVDWTWHLFFRGG